MGPSISALWKIGSLRDLKREEKPSRVGENQDCHFPSSEDNGPGKRKPRKKKADFDSETSSDSNMCTSCDIEPAPGGLVWGKLRSKK
ncbi:unnamed protein product [Allacma fusca]|uniref:Uncharacterized protein n=1 Tax=Allacma fusca TaxID=39272 RepID=A0A8J2PAX5_9HEXA|nr:unnamed protein product [Allacma fusca]